MWSRRLALTLLLLWAPAASAQTYVELILDASGSMWNKLADDRYRIVAAKEVLADFVSGLPADETLHVGLRVYGSRTKAIDEGACQDSELFVPIDGIAREALLTTVRDAQARGATPIAYSLQEAAKDFPAEGRKLIVLVTDGEESCGGDLRAVMDGIEAQGIEIDLRIIGFDLTPEAQASFAGVGTFENATSAAELATALGRAVETAAPAEQALYPVTVTVTRQGQPAADGAAVTFSEAVSGEIHVFAAAAPGSFSAELPAGAYSARVEDAFSEAPLSFSGLSVTPEGENAFTFELASEVEVTLVVSPADPVTGSEVTVTFEGAPAGEGNWITVVPADVPDEVYLDYDYVASADGQVALRVPDEPMSLQARYHLDLPGGGSRVIGRSESFASRAVPATLAPPAEVPAGARFEVAWTGPANDGDFVTVVPVGAEESSYGAYFYTSDGSPGGLLAPIEAGEYEVRYQSAQTHRTLASQPLTVTPATASLQAPGEIESMSKFEVGWSGPNNEGDYVTLVPAGAAEGSYREYFYTAGGNPGILTGPEEPGSYELRYVSGQGDKTLARAAVAVTAVSASLEAPAEVAAGSSFEVRWVGPDNDSDYVTIVPAGAAEGAYRDYAYTREGNPVTLSAPGEPGAYELRYSSDASGGKIFASRAITVGAVEISLDAPSEVAAGATFEVAWSGPDGERDYITIVPAGSAVGTYFDYAYTSEGSPVTLTAPGEPGAYEIWYASDRVSGTFGRRPITVR